MPERVVKSRVDKMDSRLRVTVWSVDRDTRQVLRRVQIFHPNERSLHEKFVRDPAAFVNALPETTPEGGSGT